MKTILFTCAVLMAVLSVHAQNLKKKTETSGNRREVFYIDKKSEMIEGQYSVINTENKDTLASGQYKNGIRTGIWSFFDTKTGEKKLDYNYAEKNIAFINPELFPDSFLIRVGDNFVFEKVDRPLILVGYDDELKIVLAKEIKIPVEIYKKQISGSVMIGYIIDEQGNFKGSKLLMPLNPKIEQEINRIVNSFSGRFLPAVYQGKPVQSMLMVKANLVTDKNAVYLRNKAPYLHEVDILCTHETVRRTVTTKKITTTGSFVY